MFNISLICKYFFEDERKLYIGYVDSTQSKGSNDEDYEVKSNESLGYPLFPMEHEVFLPKIDVLGSNEIIHNVPIPKQKLNLFPHF